MNRKVSEKLILNLSLYLDNKLSKVEMLEIEELLKFDSEVAQIIDSLKNTREVLRNTPKIKRRRSFMLTPEHSKQAKQQSGVLSGMRMITSLLLSKPFSALPLTHPENRQGISSCTAGTVFGCVMSCSR
jgi:hypothetical protein